MKLVAGELVTEGLRLVHPLGEGGMGNVWLARHAQLQREVAVKFISDEALQRPGVRARFEREAKLATRIQNPHVVQVFDHGITADGTPYIVMERLRGQTLRERLAQRVVTQGCTALAAAHALDIVHRDIKPDNIFMVDEPSGEPFIKVLDFGIARTSAKEQLSPLTASGTVLGTPLYMSPEQLVGEPVELSTDLWSLAVVAYETLVGQPPFAGSNIGQLTISVTRSEYLPPSAISDAPASIDQWFARAFHRSPGARFASANDMQRAWRSAHDETAGAVSQQVADPEPHDAPPTTESGHHHDNAQHARGRETETVEAVVQSRRPDSAPAPITAFDSSTSESTHATADSTASRPPAAPAAITMAHASTMTAAKTPALQRELRLAQRLVAAAIIGLVLAALGWWLTR